MWNGRGVKGIKSSDGSEAENVGMQIRDWGVGGSIFPKSGVGYMPQPPGKHVLFFERSTTMEGTRDSKE